MIKLRNIDYGATSRDSSVVVASVNASTEEKKQADYVCTGVSDEDKINDAITEASSIGGTVKLSRGYFIISSPIIPASKITLAGNGIGATIIKIANGANTYAISWPTAVAANKVTLRDFEIEGNKANQTEQVSRDLLGGIYMADGTQATTDITLENLNVHDVRHGSSIRLANVTRLNMSNVTCINNGGAAGGVLQCDGTWLGSCVNANIVNYHGSSNTDTGLAMDNCSFSHVNNAVCNANTNQGFAAGQGSNYLFWNTCTAKSNLNHGFSFGKFGGSAVHNLHVLGCNMRQNSVYGIDLSDITAIMLLNSNVSGNGTGPVGIGANVATRMFRNNIGLNTEYSGTATVANGQTSVVVTHSLGVTPTLQDIVVTPTNSMGNATKYYISTPTATEFTINVNADPGATTATFVWKAMVDFAD